jgi:hypothetical protein
MRVRGMVLRGPLPKKMMGLFGIREEGAIIGDVLVIIEVLELAVLVEAVEGGAAAADAVDEEFAVEVVDFMLKDAGEMAVDGAFDFVAVLEGGAELDVGVAGYEAVDTVGDRETALVILDEFTFLSGDLGVDESCEVSVGLVL